MELQAKKKVIVMPCSGIGKALGSVSREAALEVVDRVAKASDWARKYSLVANSIRPPVLIEPTIQTEA